MKKLLSLIICAALLGGCLLTGCGSSESSKDNSGSSGAESGSAETKTADPMEGLTAAASTDKYRNVYQIFTQSFCDSDGDGVGDFKGIISQLDYINDGDPNGGDETAIPTGETILAPTRCG